MEPVGHDYLHGYTSREGVRLVDQATTLSDLLHHDTRYGAGEVVLEAGCGVGAQTIMLAKNSPETQFISVDISPTSLETAEATVGSAGCANVEFQQADIFDLPFGDQSFDHIFVCFVLEHMRDPVAALLHLKAKLREDGPITVIEGDHGSSYYHPASRYAQQAIQCLIDLQAEAGGNSLIGRELYPLMQRAEFRDVDVSPRLVYVDASRPALVEGFTKNTFTAMVEGVRQPALDAGLMDEVDWERGIRDLYRAAEPDGTFCYTFFKGIGVR